MKKSLLVLIFAVSSILAFSQLVTISGENQIPQIGQEIIYNNINPFGFNLYGVPDGTSTIWDYSTLTITDELTFTYSDATLEADAALFPQATIAEAISGIDGLMYYQTGNYFMARKGVTGPMYMNYFTDSAKLYDFPITAGENIECNYTGILEASGLEMEIDNGNIDITADAQGTITLPNGTTLYNVLRLHVEETFRGMYDMGTGPMEVLSIDDDFYYWFHEDYTNPIFVYGITTTSSLGSADEETEALRFQPIIASGTNNENFNTSQNVYPNPSTGLLNINNCDDFSSGSILDIYGKEIRTFKPNNTIDISDLNSGIYFIMLDGINGKQLSKVVLEK